MVDFDALMDPSGGTGFGQKSFGSGFAAVLGLQVSSWAMGKDSYRKLALSGFKEQRNLVGKAFTGNKGNIRVIKNETRLASLARRAGRNSNTGLSLVEQNIYSKSKWGDFALKGKSANTRLARVRTQFRGIANAEKSAISAYQSTMKGFKMLSYAFWASDALTLATMLTTPSPSLSAKAQIGESNFMSSGAVFSGGATARQRSLQAIHDSQLAINPILGNEAQYLHQ